MYGTATICSTVEARTLGGMNMHKHAQDGDLNSPRFFDWPKRGLHSPDVTMEITRPERQQNRKLGD